MQLLREIGLAETRRGIGNLVIRTPEIRRVVLAPGSCVLVRMPQPPEQVELSPAPPRSSTATSSAIMENGALAMDQLFLRTD